MVRLGALISRERRIEVLPLHGANRPRDVAVTGIRDAREEAGDLLEERISVLHRQRTGCGKDGGDLTVGQSKRRHAADSAAGTPRHTRFSAFL
jgi:hypothetical protein